MLTRIDDRGYKAIMSNCALAYRCSDARQLAGSRAVSGIISA